jgi:hypothetical protein
MQNKLYFRDLHYPQAGILEVNPYLFQELKHHSFSCKAENLLLSLCYKSNVMKTAIRKSSAVILSFKQIVHLLVESFESPQTRQFKRWKSFIGE